MSTTSEQKRTMMMLFDLKLITFITFITYVHAGPFTEVGKGIYTEVYGGGEESYLNNINCNDISSSSNQWLPLSTFCKTLSCSIENITWTPMDPKNGRTDGHIPGCYQKSGNVLRDLSDGQAEWIANEIFKHSFSKKNIKNIKNEKGVFLEFGSKDGRYQSNTFLFESAFGWEGLLIEIFNDFILPLRQMRKCVLNNIKGSCVYSALDNIIGNELVVNKKTTQVFPSPLTSDHILALGSNYETFTYKIKTLTLDFILSKFNVKHIDLLSADCEGCESIALRGRLII